MVHIIFLFSLLCFLFSSMGLSVFLFTFTDYHEKTTLDAEPERQKAWVVFIRFFVLGAFLFSLSKFLEAQQ